MKNSTVFLGSDNGLLINLGNTVIKSELGLRVGAAAIIIALNDVSFVFDGGMIHRSKSIRLDPVVWLENTDKFPFGAFEAEVHAVAVTGIFLIDDRNARIFFSEALHDGKRAVSGAIIDTDNLEIAKSLADEAGKRLSEILLNVVNWDKNRKFGRHILIIT